MHLIYSDKNSSKIKLELDLEKLATAPLLIARKRKVTVLSWLIKYLQIIRLWLKKFSNRKLNQFLLPKCTSVFFSGPNLTKDRVIF